MAATKSATVNEVTETYLASLDLNNLPFPEVMESELLTQTCAVFEIENASLPKGQKWQMPQTLFNIQVARLLAYCGNVVRIAAAGLQQDPSYDLIGIYVSDGEDAGTYVTDPSRLRGEIAKYNRLVSQKDVDEIVRWLYLYAPRRERTQTSNLVAMNNGVFDYDTKRLMPFSPQYVFTVKSHVDYNPVAQNVVLHNPDDGTDWDVESWMKDISDDPEIVELLWQVVGSVLRPNAHWDKSVWFYSEIGSNGKGTLCTLMRNLLGEHAYASIPLSDFSKDFMLEPLVSANAIIVDENDVGVFVDKAANLKAIITGDVIQINRKFKAPIAYRFNGVMVQCLNELPRIKDRSDSFYRRQLFIPFEKSFTGQEKKYIKNDYLARREVLEYVAFKVLNMNYTKFSEPAACLQALDYYKEYNDPVRQFVEEVVGDCVWDLLPYSWLYALYRAWFTRNAPSGTAISRNTFIHDLSVLLRNDQTWAAMSTTDNALRADKYMTECEPLTVEYNLKEWYNPNYSGNDPDKIGIPPQTSRYRGLIKRTLYTVYAVSNLTPADNSDEK